MAEKVKISDLNFPAFNRVTDSDLFVVVDAETNETKKATKKQILAGIASIDDITSIVDAEYIGNNLEIPDEKIEAVVDADYISNRLDLNMLDDRTRNLILSTADSDYINALVRDERISSVVDSDYVYRHLDLFGLIDSDYVNETVKIEAGKKLFTAAEKIDAGQVVSLNNQGLIEKPVITQVDPNFSDTLVRTGTDGVNLRIAYLNDTQGSLVFLFNENGEHKISAGRVTAGGVLEMGPNTHTLSTEPFNWDIAGDTIDGNHFLAVGDNGDGEGITAVSGHVDANLNIVIYDTFVENSLSSRHSKVVFNEKQKNYLWVGTDVFGTAIITINPNTGNLIFSPRIDLSSVFPNSIAYQSEHDLVYIPSQNKFIGAFTTSGAEAKVFTVVFTVTDGGDIIASAVKEIQLMANTTFTDLRLFSAARASSVAYLQFSYVSESETLTSYLELTLNNSAEQLSAGTIQTLPSSVQNPTWQYDEVNSVFFFYGIVDRVASYSTFTKKSGLLTRAQDYVPVLNQTAEYQDKGSESIFVKATHSVVFHIQTTAGPYAFVLKNYAQAEETVKSIIGIAAETIEQGEAGFVTVTGGINEANPGLVVGANYFIDGMGTITTDTTSFGAIGRALSDGHLLVDFDTFSSEGLDSAAVQAIVDTASFETSGFTMVNENLVNKLRSDRRIQVPHGIQSGVQFGLDDFDGGVGDVLHIYAETLRAYQDSAPAEETRLYIRARNDLGDKVAIWTQDDFGLVHTTDGLLENVIWHEGNLDPYTLSKDLDLAGYRLVGIGGANFIDLDVDETTDGSSNNVVVSSVQGIYNIIDANYNTAPTSNHFGVWRGNPDSNDDISYLSPDNALFLVDSEGNADIAGTLDAKEIINGKFMITFGGNGLYTLSDQYGNWFPTPENNPVIFLRRGETYLFNVQSTGHPFEIRTGDQGPAYNDGITNNSSDSGIIKFKVPMSAPKELYYQCTAHPAMGNKIYILGEPTSLDDIAGFVDSDYIQQRIDFELAVDSDYVEQRFDYHRIIDSDYVQERVDFTPTLDSAEVLQVVTSSELDMNGNKVLFSNVYATEADLPDATTYHGMFAHVHETGAGYFAHNGGWVRLGNFDDISALGLDSAEVEAMIDSDYVKARQEYFDYENIIDAPYVQSRVDFTGYATETWVGDQGYLKSADLSTYATQQWVGEQGYLTDYTVTQGDVTQHQSALSITESQISDLQNYLTSADMSSYATQQWVGDQGYLTDYDVTQADVTQHQSALSITESQISNLQDYLLAADLNDYATQQWVLQQDFGGDNLSHDNGNFIDLDVDEVFSNAIGSVNDIAISSAQGIYNIIDNNKSTETGYNTSNKQFFGVWSGKSTGSGEVADLRTTNAVFLVDEDGNTTIKGNLTVNDQPIGGALVDGEFNVGYGNANTTNQELITGITAARREIFDSWYRFSHDTSGNYPANATEMGSFQFDEANLNVYSPLNTSTVVGFVSPAAYKDYDFDTMLNAQGNGDDDGIGVLLAWATDAQGREHTITLWRAMGYGGGVGFAGGGNSYFMIYNAGQSDAQIIFDGDTLAPHVSDTTNWDNYSTFVSVTKRGKSFSVACSQFKIGASTVNDIDESTRHNFNLEDWSFGPIFNEETNYGYVAHSQPLATWTGTEFYGEGIRLYTDFSQFYTFVDDENIWFPTIEANPILYLRRGDTYKFNVNANNHPFQIKYSYDGELYNNGVTNNNTDDGEIIFKVPMNAPATLYYRCSLHGAMGNAIFIV